MPSAWVAQVARERADLFVPATSIHPHRKDAIEELARGRWALAPRRSPCST
ncbi:hypothetical protein L6R52_22675 [Myxococcota bacterium]|nr:hypothetical protein [Myxococcota bacterium]